MRFHVGIGKGIIQRAHTVRVRTRAADRAVELGLADFAGRALGAVASIAAIVAAWNTELKAHVTDPSKLVCTVACWPGSSVVTLSTMAWAKGGP
jgi:hypothetical protein